MTFVQSTSDLLDCEDSEAAIRISERVSSRTWLLASIEDWRRRSGSTISQGGGKITGTTKAKDVKNLQETLDRVERGEGYPHKNDGTTFENRKSPLPEQPLGYYKEYVVPTDGTTSPGAQRVVIGAGGDAYYSPDHYNTFQKIE